MNFINQILENLKDAKYKDNIWGVHLDDMQLTSKCHKRIRFLICMIDIFSKYAWFGPLKDKKGVTISKYF